MNPVIVNTSINKLSLTIKTKDDGSVSSHENTSISMGQYVPSTHQLKLEDLSDVNVDEKSDGSVLIYNANSNKYDMKQLPPIEIVGLLDNGEF